MWKRLHRPHLSRPKLLLWLLVLGLLLLTAWQGLQVAKLGDAWQALPQRTLAKPLVDYAEQEAVRAILADDATQAQRLVNELTAAELISSAQLYGEEGRLLAQSIAESVVGEDASSVEKAEEKIETKAETKEPATEAKTSALTYVRPLYQEAQPLGFLRLQLANNPLALAQQGIWRQLEHHLSWLLPLCLLLGLLFGMALQHWRQRRALKRKDETQQDLETQDFWPRKNTERTEK